MTIRERGLGRKARLEKPRHTEEGFAPRSPPRTDARSVVSIAKITPPKGSGILPRARLFQRLDANGIYPLTWVCAPAGSGKTSLLTSYLSKKRTPCVWYRVDEGDTDIATFFYYLGLAARKAAPRKRSTLPLFTPEYAQGVQAFTLRYFERFFELFKAPFILVLDNYHLVPEQSKLHEVIAAALECLPEGRRLIIAGRQDPPPAFARTRVSGGLGFLEAEAMLFTRAETEDILRRKGVDWLAPETLDRVHETTRGWAAGLVLIAESARRSRNRAIPDLSTPEIFDYIAAEIFARTEPARRQFFLRTACMPGLTAALAERLTGEAQAGELLADLYRGHFFVEKDTAGDPFFRYHPLFREFLLARARETLSREEIVDLQRRGAALLMEQGQVDDAAALFLDAHDWDGFIPFLLAQAPALMSQGRTQTLAGWLGCIPEEMRVQTPWLLYWAGASTMGTDTAASYAAFERAFRLFEARGDEVGTLLAWSGAVNVIFFEFGDFKRSDQWIDWLYERMRRDQSFPTAEIELAVVAGMTGALVWRRSDHPDITCWINRALSLTRTSSNTEACFQAYMFALNYYSWMGDLGSGQMVLNESRQKILDPEVQPIALIFAKSMEAHYCASTSCQSRRAVQLAAEGLAMARATGIHALDQWLMYQGALGALAEGDESLIQAYVEGLRVTAEGRGLTSQAIYLGIASLQYLLKDELPSAVAFAEQAVLAVEEAGAPVGVGIQHVILAKAVFEMGDHRRALRELAIVDKIAEPLGSQQYMFFGNLIKAYFAFVMGDERAGVEALTRGMRIGRQTGFGYAIYLWRSRPFVMLCAKALEYGIEVDYVRGRIIELRLFPESPPVELEHWPWAVKVSTLGRFAVEIDGEPLVFAGKAQRKPLAMLKVLIALGAREVREEQIADILWPDADGDMAYTSLRVTLARLRKLTGHAEAIQVMDGRLSLDPRLCWVDTDAFSQILSQAEAADASHDEARAARLMRKAVALYRGVFLANEPEELWFEAQAERLRSRFLKAVGWLARHHEQAEEWAQAAQCYERCLEVDDSVEEAYRNLMLCYRRLGRYGEAVAVYRRCAKTLETTFRAAPSPATVNAYAALLSEQRGRPAKPKRSPKAV